ncbi:glycosyltransferase [Advenella sp. WQ 585]|uniref:Glycosyltransferase n=1 Tax=Advenella mandrilli TaxID=2800330 RepID=A0ABS1EFV3_9BURK|nr:glycosyltransferase [Advenella mandrilli]MBK1781661.1 glycosyltransferase [Advenella mandrilli]
MKTNKKIRVVHMISGLLQGGAESVLFRLVTWPDPDVEHIVVSFADAGIYGQPLMDAGVEVKMLGMTPGRLTPADFWRLKKCLVRLNPDVIQTWMYHADLIGGLAARMGGFRHIAWGIRNSGASLAKSSRSAYLFARLSGFFSRWLPQQIICCAEDARHRHVQWGYAPEKMVVIQNGYDLSRWARSEPARHALRTEWGLTEQTPLIGFVARWNPLKDHDNLIQAFAQCLEKQPDLRCVLVGKDMDAGNPPLMALLTQYGVKERTILLGMRNDVPQIMSALDLHVLSSIAEGFPNVVAEAMACGVPNVVTDVGDAALIVGDDGWVVPASDPAQLAEKIMQALDVIEMTDKNILAKQVRARVMNAFSLEKMVTEYRQTWLAMLGANGKAK